VSYFTLRRLSKKCKGSLPCWGRRTSDAGGRRRLSTSAARGGAGRYRILIPHQPTMGMKIDSHQPSATRSERAISGLSGARLRRCRSATAVRDRSRTGHRSKSAMRTRAMCTSRPCRFHRARRSGRNDPQVGVGDDDDISRLHVLCSNTRMVRAPTKASASRE